MRSAPETAELVAAVRSFLTDHAMPALSGRDAYHARVAANALGIVERELTHGASADAAELASLIALMGLSPATPLDEANRTLATTIRDGAIDIDDQDLVDHLWATTLATVAIDQPRYATYRALAEDGSVPTDPGRNHT